jgi:5-deoxy-glucuronate isomerase
MPNLKVKPSGTHGRVTHVTPENAGWTYVGFDLHRMKPGETVSGETGDREVCLVWVTGKGKASAGTKDFGTLGGRMNPFEGAPHALYIPMESTWSVTAETDLELAVCSAPGGGTYQAKAIPPGTHPQVTRGKGTNVRYVNNIMPEDDSSAHSLLTTCRTRVSWKRPITIGSTRRRASLSSASIPTIVRSTKRWRSRTAM